MKQEDHHLQHHQHHHHHNNQGQCCSSSSSYSSYHHHHNNNNNNTNNYHQQQELLLVQQQQQQQQIMMQQQNNTNVDHHHGFAGGGGFSMFPSDQVSQWSIPQVPFINHHHDPFLVPPPQQQQPPPPPQAYPYGGLFNRSSSLFNHLPPPYGNSSPSSESLLHHDPFFGGNKMTAQEIMEAKALAASKSHSEAERRRRERINNHLARLRSLLPNTTKTDKASLLAEVIQHVKELKRQTSLIEESSPVPTEADELTVDAADDDGRFVIKASLCCEDRSDLLPELIKTLKALKLRTLKADITTLGGRVRNVLFITAEDEHLSSNDSDDEHGHGHARHFHHHQQQYCISSIQEALKAVMEKGVGGADTASAGVKRQRTNIISIS